MAMPYYLAPMAALSHRALRELIYSFGGCDEYFTEMISAPGLLDGGPLERYYVDTQPDPGKVVFQLVGAQEDQLLKAAEMLDRYESAGLDINMGCSAHEIVKIGAGSAWLDRPEASATLIRRLRRVFKHRLSVKLRLVPSGSFEKLVEFCRLLEGEGVELITLHPRMVKEKLKRRARWDQVAALRGELRIPVAGNGDLTSAETLVQRASGPWDAVMVGRGAVRAPWIFAQSRAMEGRDMKKLPDRIDLLGVAENFLNLLE